MKTTYQIQILQLDHLAWIGQLQKAIDSEIKSIGVSSSVKVACGVKCISSAAPSLTLIFGSKEAKSDPAIKKRLRKSLDSGQLVIPVVDDCSKFSSLIPNEALKFNAFEWTGINPAQRLAHITLQQLGIEERDRRIFISHRRNDGSAVAEQLFDELSHRGFEPFVDRFNIRQGEDVQKKITNVLDDCAFLLLLETPEASDSEWVQYEVYYALAHHMGILILQWPQNPQQIPATSEFERYVLDTSDIVQDAHGINILAPGTVDNIVNSIEDAHANALVRRKNELLKSVQDIAHEKSAICIPLKDWCLAIHSESKKKWILVQVISRLPTCTDLEHLDEVRGKTIPAASAELVFTAQKLDPLREHHLDWVIGAHSVEYISGNKVGRKW